MEFLQKEERTGTKFPSKREGLGGWKELVPEVPYYSSLQRYLDFSFQFYYAKPVDSLEEMMGLEAQEGDVVKFEDKFFIFTGGEE